MGHISSTLRETYFSIRALLAEISSSNTEYNHVLARIRQPPSIPAPNPTTSFWTLSPPHPPIVDAHSPTLPQVADIVIIGSGISGASIARTILTQDARNNPDPKSRQQVVMLEARAVTNGATGRNGGHMKLTPYEMLAKMKKKFSSEAARKIVRFQASHAELLVGMARREGWSAGEARMVETVDFFWDEESWVEAKEDVEDLREEMPELAKGLVVWERVEAVEKFHISSHVHGAISYTAGALWPYRLITSIIASLLSTYSDNFFLETHTPVTAITLFSQSSTTSPSHPYILHTPRGLIAARHVIHATNGHAAKLLPGLIEKMIPVRAQMSAQRPGQSFHYKDGKTSWGFSSKRNMEYMIQIPPCPSPSISSSKENEDDKEDTETETEPTASTLLLGGALFHSGGSGLDEIGNTDDGEINLHTGSYLAGMLPLAFGSENWGLDHPRGRIREMWTGVLGFTVDLVPFVGRVDGRIAGRDLSSLSHHVSSPSSLGNNEIDVKTTTPRKNVKAGEWIAAGYSGEGMVNAWLCGVAVGLMVLGLEDQDMLQDEGSDMPRGKVRDWLPDEYLLSKRRLDRASIYEFALMFG